MLLAFYGVEPQILSKIEEETGVISTRVKGSRPPMRSIASYYITSVFAVVSSHVVVFLFTFNSHDNDISLPHKVLLIFKGLQHGLNTLRVLVRLQWEYLDRLYPFLNDWIVRQVKVQYYSYLKLRLRKSAYWRRHQGCRSF